jgi:hypothetical protein
MSRNPGGNPCHSSSLGLFIIALGSVALVIGILLCAWGKWPPSFLIFLLIVFRLSTGLGKALRRELTDEALEQGSRPFIIYLREFTGESSFSQLLEIIYNLGGPSLEECLQSTLSSVGPLKALGKPGTKLAKAGAIREYMGSEADWKAKIREEVERARLIIIRLGDTPNLLFELREVVQRKNPASILIIINDTQAHTFNSISRSSRKKAYELFRREVGAVLKFPPIEDLAGGIFLWFTPSGDPIVLKKRSPRQFVTLKPSRLLYVESTLEPVVRYFEADNDSYHLSPKKMSSSIPPKIRSSRF